RRIERVRRQSRIAQICGVELGFCHHGVAEITANKTLIRLTAGGVHDVGTAIQWQAAITLMRPGLMTGAGDVST
ncbi:MAG: hypothetical protein WCC81_11480, partial [Pseudolabrys sp.]